MSHKRVPQTFPLAKFMDPVVDDPLLSPERQVVDAVRATEGQHPLRWWEYAMAHRAIGDWQLSGGEGGSTTDVAICDVGGAGSRFHHSLRTHTEEDITLIDPTLDEEHLPGSGVFPFKLTVEAFAASFTHDQFDILTAISVLEHVAGVPAFLRACRMLLRPGGLLVLTVDAWNCDGADTAHFHWMRHRIYNADSIRALLTLAREIGFRSFGRSDWTYHGNHVYDYTFASLALTRKP